jgi:pimeloyl-ACP methyl ester carboxylesterase
MTTNAVPPVQTARFLPRPDGRVGYDVEVEGPLVVFVPGMGDLRSTYRMLAPIIRSAGYRVACTDLRGHGDSDASFATYGDQETAGDVAALIDELGGPAVIVGNSMGAGAATLVAADRPEVVAGLVLVGPFVRNGKTGAITKLVLRAAMARPWAAMVWKSYLPTLYAGRRPDDFDEHRDRMVASIRRPGYARAFSLTTRTNHGPAEARLGDVSAATMVIMGEQDPDFPDPATEAAWIAQALCGEVVMVADSGHYPQSQRPDITADAVLRFIKAVGADA